jgi:hypothetical protein
MPLGYNLTIIEKDPQAHGYIDVAFPREYSGIAIYIFFPKDGSGKGTVLSKNHDNVP